MMNTTKIFVSDKHPIFPYFEHLTTESKNLRNRTLFLMRNTVTALSKDVKDRHPLEQEALDTVLEGLRLEREKKKAKFDEDMKKTESEEEKKKLIETFQKNLKKFRDPDREKPWLNYSKMDAILKNTGDRDYYALPSQINQKAVSKTTDAWSASAASVREWKKSPGKFTRRPGFPGYIKSDRTTAQLTNQVCKYVEGGDRLYFRFPKTDIVLDAGPGSVYSGKFIKAEVVPEYGGFTVCLTFETDKKKPVIPEKPERIMGIDMGIDNFMTCATNFPSAPFIISGKWLKMENQYFNKERAKLLSAMTRGEDSKHSKKTSRRLTALSKKRGNKFRDFFYKAAHAVCRIAVQNKVEVLVVGKSDGWKQSSNLGEKNNQNFVSIPFCKTLYILMTVASGYDLPVIFREESYTSKANCLGLDPIPDYGDKEIPEFTGKRIHRGLYKTNDGRILNADINGAANILRKEYPDAFSGKGTMDWLCGPVLLYSRNGLMKTKHIHDKSNKGYRKRREERQHLKKEMRARKKFDYMKLFQADCPARKKAWSLEWEEQAV